MIKFFRNILILLIVFFPSCSELDIEQTNEDWSFVVFGDLRLGYGIYGKLVNIIVEIEPTPKYAICLGDIVNTASNEAEWENFWLVSKPLTDIMPLHISRGNHEGNDEISELVYREQTGINADTFYYSFTYDQTHFIILDSYIRNEEQSIGPNQLIWLQSQLTFSVSNNIENVFIFFHHPLYPQGFYQGDDLKNADEAHSLFDNYSNIKAVFMAHEHSFNKFIKDDIVYITTGGAGASLYTGFGGDYHHFVKVSFFESTNKFNIKTIGVFGETVDQFDL